MVFIDTLYELIRIKYFYITIGILTIFYLSKITIKIFNNLTNNIVLHPYFANKVNIGIITKYKTVDIQYYEFLYNVYKIIGSSVKIDKSDIFDEAYLLKLNEAKKIFYEVKRNKNLVKSNYLLIKIFKKIQRYDIKTSEIDDTIIYLMMLILNKNKKQLSD